MLTNSSIVDLVNAYKDGCCTQRESSGAAVPVPVTRSQQSHGQRSTFKKNEIRCSELAVYRFGVALYPLVSQTQECSVLDSLQQSYSIFNLPVGVPDKPAHNRYKVN